MYGSPPVLPRRNYPQPQQPPRHPVAKSLARRQAHPQANPRQPHPPAAGTRRRHPPCAQGRSGVDVPARSVRRATLPAPRARGRRAGAVPAVGVAAAAVSHRRANARAGPGGAHRTGVGAGVQARHRPAVVPRHRRFQPRRGAGAGCGQRQRSVEHARLVAEAPAVDRARPRAAVSERRHPGAVRHDLQLPGGAVLPHKR